MKEINLDQTGVGIVEAIRMYQHLEYFLNLRPPYRLLDVGTGKGFLVEYFRERGVEAYGIDLRSVFPRNKGFFVITDGCRMPFANHTLDVVTERLTFDLVLDIWSQGEKAKAILLEMDRVLKPGGYIYSECGRIPRKDLFALGYTDLNKHKDPVCFTYQKPK